MIALRHLRLVSGLAPGAPGTARKSENAEMCLVDYASCKVSDVCWLVDFDSDCDQSDNCLIDTT